MSEWLVWTVLWSQRDRMRATYVSEIQLNYTFGGHEVLGNTPCGNVRGVILTEFP